MINIKFPNFKKKSNKPKIKNRLALQGGSYSLAVSTLVLAILIVLNICVTALPSSYTSFDLSASKLYSITSSTKVVVNALEEDVTIYWIVQSEQEDPVIENLLNKYKSLSDHIEIVKQNPDVYPTFTEQYTSEDVPNNSLIVECAERSRYISYDEIYLTEFNYASYSYEYSFDGEGAITSAIDYVVNEEQPQLYILSGHGEETLSESFSNQLEKENIETVSFSLLTENGVPEEADCVLIYAPSSDISEEESDMLTEYVENGGKLLVFAGPTEEGTLTNIYSILADYGVEVNDGIVIEEDYNYYAFQSPYILLPTIQSSDITDPLLEESYYAIMGIAQGMSVGETDNGEVTQLLTTSDSSFSKIDGYDITTYEKEDNDIDGPFALALSIDANSGGQIVWFSSSLFLDDVYNSYSSGANLDLAMNALSYMVGENEAVSIRSKSLNYDYLTIIESTSSLLKKLMIGIFPLAYLAIGFIVIFSRRRRRNETV